jgi:SNW domain-containing protein 1
MPGREEIEKSKQDTMDALRGLVEDKMRKANPKSLPVGTVQPAPQYIKYTPTQQGAKFNSGAEHRIIQMQDMPTDPLEPPKFRHQKVPRVPDTTPVPVLHSPPRAITREDQDNWKIPPSVSAWKNAKVRTSRYRLSCVSCFGNCSTSAMTRTTGSDAGAPGNRLQQGSCAVSA